MIDYAGVRTYAHGGSAAQDKNVMAPYLLHWKLIEDAKEKGLKWYDFWGIAPNDDPNHPWAGITRFKKGFGGEGVHYAGTYDALIKTIWYNAYQLAKVAKKKKPWRNSS